MKEHFPNIYARCLELGIDITRQPIPVVPAAHYTCGGVVTDLRAAPTLPGLYAIGETAFTGLHGANRLASNSLLECLVFARAAAQRHRKARRCPRRRLPDWDESRVTDADEAVVISHNWDELRRFMWDYVGIVRTDKRLDARCTASNCCRTRSTSTTATSASRAICSNCATWSCRRPDRAFGAGRATRAAACISAATTRRRCPWLADDPGPEEDVIAACTRNPF